jgi:hypothetical protein
MESDVLCLSGSFSTRLLDGLTEAADRLGSEGEE